VWAGGNRPSPLVTDLARATGNTAVLATEPTLRVIGLDRVWAAGDCARIPDLDSGGAPYPPTAQHAIREGRVVADNIAAVLAGRAPVEFRFRAIGVLVALGHRTAVAEIRGRQFSGLAAWLLWRGIYLSKLPGLEKRIRVLLDWLIDLAFPRDIVVTAAPPRPGTTTAPNSEARVR
jgi:NADH:ubiquinone reductase (H+-translocating)